MTTINLNDLNETTVVSEQEAADVKGGPIYMQYEGIKGNVTPASAHTGGVNVCLGDGSVRF
jgi:prepilin-type processing-associated H-X9-DG protein